MNKVQSVKMTAVFPICSCGSNCKSRVQGVFFQCLRCTLPLIASNPSLSELV